jgi:hypothetical protein
MQPKQCEYVPFELHTTHRRVKINSAGGHKSREHYHNRGSVQVRTCTCQQPAGLAELAIRGFQFCPFAVARTHRAGPGGGGGASEGGGRGGCCGGGGEGRCGGGASEGGGRGGGDCCGGEGGC